MKKVNIEVKEISKDAMYLTQHFGNGSLGDTEFDAKFTLPTFSLIVEIGETRYMVSQQDIISEIVRLHEEAKVS